MYYDTSSKTCRRDWSELSSPGSLRQCHVFFVVSDFFRGRIVSKTMEESDGERAATSDTVEGTEERDIRVIPIMTTLSFVRTVKDKARGVRVTSNREKISSFGLNVPARIKKKNLSRWCG